MIYSHILISIKTTINYKLFYIEIFHWNYLYWISYLFNYTTYLIIFNLITKYLFDYTVKVNDWIIYSIDNSRTVIDVYR